MSSDKAEKERAGRDKRGGESTLEDLKRTSSDLQYSFEFKGVCLFI